jgi:hypothetical protein
VRRRLVLLALAALALLATAAAATPAGAATRVIGPNVSVGGVDVSGLTPDRAAWRVTARLYPVLRRPLTLVAAGRRHRLSPTAAGWELDVDRLVARALAARRPARRPRPGAPAPRPPRRLDIPAEPAVDTARVLAFVQDVKRRTDRRPRGARMRVSLRRVTVTGSRGGRRVAGVGALARAGARALVSRAADRTLRARVVPVAAGRRSTASVAWSAPSVVTVSRNATRARLFVPPRRIRCGPGGRCPTIRFRVLRSYRVAVGQGGYPTPTGFFRVQSKAVNPTWSVPNEGWAGGLAGSTVSGGSGSNPLKARWIGFAGGVGFHGTADTGSIGTWASHGCVRMYVSDVKHLYRHVRIGTPVLVV